MATKATISERGNGFPDVGDYVSGDDGEVYVVTAIPSGRIETHGSGAANTIDAEVALADWSDVDDDSEPVCTAIIDETQHD